MQIIKIDKGIYAVFNNLILQPVYLNTKNIIDLKQNRYKIFPEEEINI